MKKIFINLLLREDELGMISNRGNSRLWKRVRLKRLHQERWRQTNTLAIMKQLESIKANIKRLH